MQYRTKFVYKSMCSQCYTWTKSLNKLNHGIRAITADSLFSEENKCINKSLPAVHSSYPVGYRK